MAGSVFGKLLTMTTWGESHGKGVGVVVDGCPAGLSLCEEDVQAYLDRRKPGQSKFTTARSEGDQVEILSGLFEGCLLYTSNSVCHARVRSRKFIHMGRMKINTTKLPWLTPRFLRTCLLYTSRCV